ncbi:MAG: aminotransferase class I/II-fold pyridoxal phosphate-dependent enzyme [Elusimicrobia bacterium]|nr:aminotransferase class I/II-fold pyridoxal phosphate-dependent enzyme [Elusimicrobiota bacterium]
MSQEAARLRRAGRDVIGLLEGEPDLPLPAGVARALSAALRAGKTRYSSSSGLPELRAAVAARLRRRNRLAVGPEGVLITNGAKQAIYEALQAVAGPGDDVLIPSPCWVTFPESVRLAGARPVLVPMPSGSLDVGRLARALTGRARAVVINTPNNPTGAVYPEGVLRELVRFAARAGLFIVSDEAYEALIYDGARHVSAGALGPEAARRTLTVGTFSKTYSMTGLRVGYLAGPAEVVAATGRIHGHLTGNVNTLAQWAALAALDVPEAELARRRAALQRRRDLAWSLASRLFPCDKPQGGLFVFADARAWLHPGLRDSATLARFLLEKARVAVVPGSACGREGWLRFSFSGPERLIREGFARIARVTQG